jgi:hypothetical protein
LRLHVGGEAGIFLGVQVGGFERRVAQMIAHDANRVGLDRSFNAGFRELLQDGGEVRGIASGDVDVAAGEGCGDDEGSGFDAVGDDAVPGAMQFGDALDANRGCACALMFAPMALSSAARSATSGSRAQFCITVSPSASVAAMSRSSVPVTVILSKTISAPWRRSPFSGSVVAST